MDNVNKAGEILGSGATVEKKHLDPQSIDAVSELKEQTLKSIEWFLDLDDPNYNSIFHSGDTDYYDLNFHIDKARTKIIFDNGIEIPLSKNDRERLSIPTLSEMGDLLSVEELSTFHMVDSAYTQVVYGDYEARDLVLLEIQKRGVDAFKGYITTSLLKACSNESFYSVSGLSFYIVKRMKEFQNTIDNENFIKFLIGNSRFISDSEILNIFETRRHWFNENVSIKLYERFFVSLLNEDRSALLLQIWSESVSRESHTNTFVTLIPVLMVSRSVKYISIISEFSKENGIDLTKFL